MSADSAVNMLHGAAQAPAGDLTWKMLTWMYGTENMALHTSIQSRAVSGDRNPETWISSQYWEYRPSVTISTV